MNWKVIHAEVMNGLKQMDDNSVQCVVTSPPYFGLRNYGHKDQIGLEKTPDEYVGKMVEVFREVKRVLKKNGTLWLNLGDSYASSWPSASNRRNMIGNPTSSGKRGPHRQPRMGCGLKEKDIMGMPWRVAFALQADGYYLRSDIIWSKNNPMPESVTDRPTKSHEYLFLMTKNAKYYYDHEAIKEKSIDEKMKAGSWNGNRDVGLPDGKTRFGKPNLGGSIDGFRNKRSVWEISTKPYPGAHFATFPQALVEPCIKAGSREGALVLDPFCGSGTTGYVALKLMRNFVGIELNPEYVKLSRKRIGGSMPMFATEI